VRAAGNRLSYGYVTALLEACKYRPYFRNRAGQMSTVRQARRATMSVPLPYGTSVGLVPFVSLIGWGDGKKNP